MKLVDGIALFGKNDVRGVAVGFGSEEFGQFRLGIESDLCFS